MRTVKFADKTQVQVTDEQGQIIESLLSEGKVDYARINQRVVARTMITSIGPSMKPNTAYKTPGELGMPELGTDDLLTDRQRNRLIATDDFSRKLLE